MKMRNIIKEINNTGFIKVIVKPNSKKNQLVGYIDSKKAFKLEIKQPAEDNKANLEIIKFFKKKYSLNIVILKGLKNKEKTLAIRK